MQRGSFRTESYDPSKPTIVMVDWVEPTAYNNGTSTVIINGIRLKPNASFKLGASGALMNGEVHIQFQMDDPTQRHDVKVNYVLLHDCPI